MADKSAIEWTDATWNPVTGCSKVSPGCAHCYAERLAMTRLAGRPGYPGLPWTPENAAENVVMRPDRLDQPLRWRRPRRIFVNSLSDLFHDEVPDAFVDRVFAVMGIASRHTFQLLTKRPGRMLAYCSDPETPTRIGEATREFARPGYGPEASFAASLFEDDGRRYWEDGFRWRVVWPLPNVWVGTSVENQRWADERVPLLLDTPAAVRFLSMEPLLGPVTIARWIPRVEVIGDDGAVHYRVPVDHDIVVRQLPELRARRPGTGYHTRPDTVGDDWLHPGPWLDWVIVGGESGPGARPTDPEWARRLRDQCAAAGVPFLFKQWGGIRPKSGGRELDGRTWDEYPEATA